MYLRILLYFHFYTMSNLTISGKLFKTFDTMTVGSNGFQKREFVLEVTDNPQYPQLVKFELSQDKCSLIDGFQPGEPIDVKFNLRGREWTNPKGETVYFNTLSPWAINRPASQTPPDSSGGPGGFQRNTNPTPVEPLQTDSADDLPF